MDPTSGENQLIMPAVRTSTSAHEVAAVERITSSDFLTNSEQVQVSQSSFQAQTYNAPVVINNYTGRSLLTDQVSRASDESASGGIVQEADRWLNERDDTDGPIEASNVIYERHFIRKGRGFPLWIPRLDIDLPLPYRAKGVSIGDVGIIIDGAFHFLFNIMLPRDDPINADGVPDDFEQLQPPIHPRSIRKIQSFSGGDHLSSHDVSRTNSNEDSFGHTFTSSASDGAILTMPEAVFQEKLLSTTRFEGYMAKHAESWYKYANGVIELEASNGDLSLGDNRAFSSIFALAIIKSDKYLGRCIACLDPIVHSDELKQQELEEMQTVLKGFTDGCTTPNLYLFGSPKSQSAEHHREDFLNGLLACLSQKAEAVWEKEMPNLPGHPSHPLTIDEIVQLQQEELNLEEIVNRSIHSIHVDLDMQPTTQQVTSLRNLANLFLKRYRWLSLQDDLEEGIWCYKEALYLTHQNDYVHLEVLVDLCSALYQRLQISGEKDDLAELVKYLQVQAVLDFNKITFPPIFKNVSVEPNAAETPTDIDNSNQRLNSREDSPHWQDIPLALDYLPYAIFASESSMPSSLFSSASPTLSFFPSASQRVSRTSSLLSATPSPFSSVSSSSPELGLQTPYDSPVLDPSPTEMVPLGLTVAMEYDEDLDCYPQALFDVSAYISGLHGHTALVPPSGSPPCFPSGPAPVPPNISANFPSNKLSPRKHVSTLAKRTHSKLPKEASDHLKAWLHRHNDHPYPSEEEERQLCHATGLSMNQVSNWMINARRRALAPAHHAMSGPSTPDRHFHSRRSVSLDPIERGSSMPSGGTLHSGRSASLDPIERGSSMPAEGTLQLCFPMSPQPKPNRSNDHEHPLSSEYVGSSTRQLLRSMPSRSAHRLLGPLPEETGSSRQGGKRAVPRHVEPTLRATGLARAHWVDGSGTKVVWTGLSRGIFQSQAEGGGSSVLQKWLNKIAGKIIAITGKGRKGMKLRPMKKSRGVRLRRLGEVRWGLPSTLHF
ncbi:hypothetical protein NLJ89_g828 [Agrocybe chaxingu]|uniref:Homeobox domain-containing protein n=1 Tax=Agrocybe chaxingu TaxID=84603 RepID=A0A9W8N181_9AGAR|nr:hypothetical protein NLJ89_g828 [Agrocybe chaxingu]